MTKSNRDVLIEAGGSTHRGDEKFAELLAYNLRAFPKYDEINISAANKLERALVEQDGVPVVFEEIEAIAVADYVDSFGHCRAVYLVRPSSSTYPGPRRNKAVRLPARAACSGLVVRLELRRGPDNRRE